MAPPVTLGENQQTMLQQGDTQQQPLKVSHREEDSMNKEPSMSGQQIVGLIIPPPDIRSMISVNLSKSDFIHALIEI
jgi:hypothetical protein